MEENLISDNGSLLNHSSHFKHICLRDVTADSVPQNIHAAITKIYLSILQIILNKNNILINQIKIIKV